MSEVLGASFPEISEPHHEQILALLRVLEREDEHEENTSYIFDKEDFGGLLTNQQYDRITIESDSDTVGVRLVRMPLDGRQEADIYTYQPNTHQLELHRVTHDYDEHFDELAAQISELHDTIENLENAATATYATMLDGIREMDDDERIAAILDQYEAEAAAIANEYETASEGDELENRIFENETMVYDAFEIVAEDEPGYYDLLQSYREALRLRQLTETAIVALDEEMATYNWVTTEHKPDPVEFIELLKATTQLIKENES